MFSLIDPWYILSYRSADRSFSYEFISSFGAVREELIRGGTCEIYYCQIVDDEASPQR